MKYIEFNIYFEIPDDFEWDCPDDKSDELFEAVDSFQYPGFSCIGFGGSIRESLDDDK